MLNLSSYNQSDKQIAEIKNMYKHTTLEEQQIKHKNNIIGKMTNNIFEIIFNFLINIKILKTEDNPANTTATVLTINIIFILV